jgi:hypothetical protein
VLFFCLILFGLVGDLSTLPGSDCIIPSFNRGSSKHEIGKQMSDISCACVNTVRMIGTTDFYWQLGIHCRAKLDAAVSCRNVFVTDHVEHLVKVRGRWSSLECKFSLACT